ncbi:hypothetical protein F4780DRAFT_797385 [Xylariomycetidae sp. FL0641]|nr:hypothetical protein F4780DRAFT_797385 [Xylariomycetidae sp. FL0641]
MTDNLDQYFTPEIQRFRFEEDGDLDILFTPGSSGALSHDKWTIASIKRWAGKPAIVGTYGIAPGHYTVFSINTELMPTQHRKKARDIMRHNYIKAYGSLESLECVAWTHIDNQDVRNAVANARTKVNGAFGQWFDVKAKGSGWAELSHRNPFIDGLEKMLKEDQGASGSAWIHHVSCCYVPKSGNATSSDPRHYNLYMKAQISRA